MKHADGLRSLLVARLGQRRQAGRNYYFVESYYSRVCDNFTAKFSASLGRAAPRSHRWNGRMPSSCLFPQAQHLFNFEDYSALREGNRSLDRSEGRVKRSAVLNSDYGAFAALSSMTDEYRDQTTYAIGSRIQNTDPLGKRGFKLIVPPCASTTHLAIASPRPAPPASRVRPSSTL